jgi:hypothetical protein
MSLKPSETFISKLKNSFRKQGILIELAYVGDDRETLLVDGKEIGLTWYPYINKIQGQDSVDVLLKDCKKEIRSMLKKAHKTS